MQPLIYLKNTRTGQTLSIYEDGRVYGKEYGNLLGTLNNESLTNVLSLIKENLYMFKTLTIYNEGLNPIVMHIRDDSRKHRNIEVIGWSQIPQLLTYIHNTESLADVTI